MRHDDVHVSGMTDPLDAFLDELRSAASDVPTPVLGEALSTLFRDGAPPQAAPAPVRRRVGLRIAVAGAVAGFSFGGLGVAGALPGPVQDAVADVAEMVGVHLPGGHPVEPARTPPTSTAPDAPPAAPSSTPAPEESDVSADEGSVPSTAVTEVPLETEPTPVNPGRRDEAPARPDAPASRDEDEVDDEGGRAEEAPGRPAEVPARTRETVPGGNPREGKKAQHILEELLEP